RRSHPPAVIGACIGLVNHDGHHNARIADWRKAHVGAVILVGTVLAVDDFSGCAAFSSSPITRHLRQMGAIRTDGTLEHDTHLASNFGLVDWRAGSLSITPQQTE